MEYTHVTSNSDVDVYKAVVGVFGGLIREMRDLSKKKPEATLSENKVKVLNRVLVDAYSILESEPEGKYLELLDSDDAPQNSDAILVMVQFEKALAAFEKRYQKYVYGTLFWITSEQIEKWNELEEEDYDDEYEDESVDGEEESST